MMSQSIIRCFALGNISFAKNTIRGFAVYRFVGYQAPCVLELLRESPCRQLGQALSSMANDARGAGELTPIFYGC